MNKSYNRKSNIEKNWEACRVRCASTSGCKKFNYYKDKRRHLTSGTSVGFRKQAEMKWKTVRQPYTCYNCCYRRKWFRKNYYPCRKNRNVRKYLPTGKILTIETSQRGSGARDYLLQPDSLYLNKKIRDVEKNKIRSYQVPKDMIK